MDYAPIRKKISSLIESKRTTATEVERLTNLPTKSLRNFLNGNVKEPKVDVIMSVAKFLNIKLEDLWNLTEDISLVSSDNASYIDVDLFKRCVAELGSVIKKKKLSVTMEEFIRASKETYQYFTTYKPPHTELDTTFINWYVDTNLLQR